MVVASWSDSLEGLLANRHLVGTEDDIAHWINLLRDRVGVTDILVKFPGRIGLKEISDQMSAFRSIVQGASL